MLSLRSCAVAIGLVLAMAVHAQQSQAPNISHLQAIQQLLKTAAFGELSLAGFRQRIAEERDPVQVKFLSSFADEISVDEIVERAAPIYMKYITRQHAIELTRFFRTPVGRKVIAGMVREAAANRPGVFDSSRFTPAELKELSAFALTTEARAWQTAPNLAADETKEMFSKLGAEVASRQNRRSANRLADQLESVDGKSSPERGKPGAAPGEKSAAGNPILDKYVEVMVDYAKRIAEYNRGFAGSIRETGILTVLLPANLVTKEGIEEGQRKIRVIGESLDGYLKSINEATDAVRRRILEVPAPEKIRQRFVAEFEQGIAEVYDSQLRGGENQRNLLDVTRRILALAESRLGSIKFQNERLLFSDTSDLETYRALVGQLDVEVKREADLRKQADDTRQQAISDLRNPKQFEVPQAASGGSPAASAGASNYRPATPRDDKGTDSSREGSNPKEPEIPQAANDGTVAASSATNRLRPSPPRDSKPADSFARNDFHLSYKLGSAEPASTSDIREKILSFWETPVNTPVGLSCTVSVVQDINGTVKSARVTRCDGGDALKRSIERAVIYASPLPRPKAGESFNPVIELTFVTDGSTNKGKAF